MASETELTGLRAELAELKAAAVKDAQSINDYIAWVESLQYEARQDGETIALLRIERDTWRPIDTAPRDGTKIDVWVVKTYTADSPVWNAKAGDIVGRRVTDVVWRGMPYPREGGCWSQQGGYNVDYELVPVVTNWTTATEVVTHWMPQPGAPT